MFSSINIQLDELEVDELTLQAVDMLARIPSLEKLETKCTFYRSICIFTA